MKQIEWSLVWRYALLAFVVAFAVSQKRQGPHEGESCGPNHAWTYHQHDVSGGDLSCDEIEQPRR